MTETPKPGDSVTHYSALEKEVYERAVEAFKNHVVTVKLEHGLYRHYHCGQPGTGNMHFHIVTFPGRLLVCGDIGDMVWERVPDMFTWAKKSLQSTGYFAEKCWKTLKVHEFSAEAAKEAVLHEHEWRTADLDSSEQDLRPGLDEIRDTLLAAADDSEHSFIEAYVDSDWYDGEFPNITGYTRDFLWAREAVRWFLDNYNPPIVEQAA